MSGTYGFRQRLAPRLVSRPPLRVRNALRRSAPSDLPAALHLHPLLLQHDLPFTPHAAMATLSVATKPSVTFPVTVASCS